MYRSLQDTLRASDWPGTRALGVANIERQDVLHDHSGFRPVGGLLARSPLQRQRARQIEEFVYDRIGRRQPSPTIREIAAHLKISVSAAHNSVGYALATGRLLHDPDTPRSLRPAASLRFDIDALELTLPLLSPEQFLALNESAARSRELVAERIRLGGEVGWDAVVEAIRIATIEVANDLASKREAA